MSMPNAKVSTRHTILQIGVKKNYVDLGRGEIVRRVVRIAVCGLTEMLKIILNRFMANRFL
jgi:hypothetical protein